jgi:hypothetical protein
VSGDVSIASLHHTHVVLCVNRWSASSTTLVEVVVVRSQEEQQGYGCSSLHGVLCDVKEASRKESCHWVVFAHRSSASKLGLLAAVLFFEVTHHAFESNGSLY